MRRGRLERTRRLGGWLLPLIGAGACSYLEPVATITPFVHSTSERVDAVLEYPPYDGMQWGLLVVDANDGRVVYRRAPAVKLIPASSMKLVVTATALRELGPDHRFRTSLRAAGEYDPGSGVIFGDLVVEADGDPTLSARFWEDDRAPLAALADSVYEAGVREVAGRLVVEASAWDSTTAVGSWMLEDLSYSATGGVFALAEGFTTLVIEGAAAPGEPPRVTWQPSGEETFVLSRVETAPPGTPRERLRATWYAESRLMLVEGRIAAGAVDSLRFGTRDPVRQAAAALERALADRGVRVHDGWAIAWEPGEPLGEGCFAGALDACGAERLAGIASPPLLEVAEAILETSNNWMSEQLVRSLGATEVRRLGSGVARGAWREGLEVVQRYLVESAGVDSLDFVLRDGSGLSTQNLLTPRALVSVLRDMRSAPWGDAFRAALAEPGEEDGTLEGRLSGLEGRVFAKTGTLTNVGALSGFLVTDRGRELAFSILANGSGRPAAWVETATDEVIRVLAGVR